MNTSILNMRRSMALREEAHEELLTNWAEKMTDARDELKALDSEGWEAWWDSDAMPDVMSHRARTLLIRARIAELNQIGGGRSTSITQG